MESHVTPAFRKSLRALPNEVRRGAFADYRLWKVDPFANSLRFKEINAKNHVWSARAGIGWRVMGVRQENAMIWFWIGSHADYDDRIINLRKGAIRTP